MIILKTLTFTSTTFKTMTPGVADFRDKLFQQWGLFENFKVAFWFISSWCPPCIWWSFVQMIPSSKRLNHACRANAEYFWNKDTGTRFSVFLLILSLTLTLTLTLTS